jgi:hypothetical protein
LLVGTAQTKHIQKPANVLKDKARLVIACAAVGKEQRGKQSMFPRPFRVEVATRNVKYLARGQSRSLRHLQEGQCNHITHKTIRSFSRLLVLLRPHAEKVFASKEAKLLSYFFFSAKRQLPSEWHKTTLTYLLIDGG